MDGAPGAPGAPASEAWAPLTLRPRDGPGFISATYFGCSAPLPPRPVPRLLSAASREVAECLADLPLSEGQTLVVAVDELPYGTLLQAIPHFPASMERVGPAVLTRTVLSYALQVAEALACLHEQGIPHGCLTPACVFLGPSPSFASTSAAAGLPPTSFAPRPEAHPSPAVAAHGAGSASPGGSRLLEDAGVRSRCVVACWGLVDAREQASQLDFHASAWPLLSYTAPECCALPAPGAAAEPLPLEEAKAVGVHAYGALLYHMFTGVPPYSQYHPAQVLVGLSAGGLQLVWPGPGPRKLPVPAVVRSLVERCLDPCACARPTLPELLQELGACVA
ncbi:hypothetical protein HYH03_011658 [Edaphochlamys debaryana]|uniref:Protein kinase domain-containing protein n=1 Tax=Edaphochlamys debaryana TaxID=47281 RepID=A0A835XUA3_9CHLO|nr:hypothetical protein HYH03_011658 [Edaphochlamys debaryana]|eukprot:KAG2489855.1 hypothetical protein HYH03_011658 [Edaphochlamys debaryana]